MERYGHASGVDFGNPDFVAFARSFGIEGFRVEKAQDIVPILENAMTAGGRPAVGFLDVRAKGTTTKVSCTFEAVFVLASRPFETTQFKND